MAADGVKIKTSKGNMEQGETGNSGSIVWNMSVPAWTLLEAGEEK